MTSEFQSTLPVGGATMRVLTSVEPKTISIHAPRGGSDKAERRGTGSERHFNPRSPWGERPVYLIGGKSQRHISIHAPRGGSDPDLRSV